MTRILASALLLLACGGGPLAAQIRGVVSDSVTRAAIVGAVITLQDSARQTLARVVTNERGEFVAPEGFRPRRVRVVRMGFRPVEVALDDRTFPIALQMHAIPTLLEAVTVVSDSRCSQRSDRRAAQALREQARAGLLSAVVSRETRPGRFVRLGFERDLTSRGQIERQTVKIDSAARTGTWKAALSAQDFVRNGFFLESGNDLVFYGPDADVLLDDAFASAYCFHLRDRNRDRPNQVGLAFVPASRRNTRVDVDGTLWIDTAQRKLVDIEFRYLGHGGDLEAARAGGHVVFWEMKNGVTFVSRWGLRIPSFASDTNYGRDGRPVIRRWMHPREIGGEVASVTWPEGHAYQGDLGTLNARAVDARGVPVAGGVVRLMDTDYIASPDAQGFFEIFNLLPGPYTATVVRPDLMPLGVALPTALRFVAQRDSIVQRQMLVPEAAPHVLPRCSGTPESAGPSPWIVARVVDSLGAPVPGAVWELRRHNDVPEQRVTESRATPASGHIHSCLRFERGDLVEVRAWRPGHPPKVEFHRLVHQPTTITITLP